MVFRRTYLRTAATVGAASLAGCSGQAGSSSGQSGAAEYDPEEARKLSPKEWRQKAAEEAKKELGETDRLIWLTHKEDSVPVFLDELEDYVEEDGQKTLAPLVGRVATQTQGSTGQADAYSRALKSDKYVADVMDTAKAAQMVKSGIEFGDVSSIPTYRQAPDNVKISNFLFPWRLSAKGMAYNTELVDEPPKSLDDLLSPRFSNKKIHIDFTPSIGPVNGLVQTHPDGWGYIEALNEQKPSFTSSGRAVTGDVANGDAHVTFMGTMKHAYNYRNDGLPITPVPNPNMHFWRITSPLTVAANAKHPWAARLMIDAVGRHPEFAIQQPGGISAIDSSMYNPEEMIGKLIPEGGPESIETFWTAMKLEMEPQEFLKKFQERLDVPTA